jgi:hypothetical protein
MSTALIIFLASAVALPLLLNEFGEWAPWLAVRLVRWTARRLGHRDDTDRYAEEWEGNLNEVPGKLAKLAVAIGMMVYAPRLRGSLKRKRARQVTSSAPPPQPGTLVGREAELEAIAKHFRRRRRGGKVAVLSVVAGMGGIGKTALAAACATRLAPSFPGGVLWLSSAERADLTSILTALGADRAEVPWGQAEQMSMLWRRTAGRRMLVVLDGVGEGRAEEVQDLSCLRLQEARCSLLITTRNSEVVRTGRRRTKVVSVGTLTRRESFQLLRARGLSRLSDSEIDQLCDRLGDLPLALAQLAVWLREVGTPASEYIRKLDQVQEALERGPHTSYSYLVKSALEKNLETLKEHDPVALALLQLYSCTDGNPLTRQRLVSAAALSLPPGLRAAVDDPAAYKRMLRSIAHRSLAEVDYVDESIHMHRFVRRLIADGMSETERSLFEEAVSRTGTPGDLRE